jgi:hypothetical protein
MREWKYSSIILDLGTRWRWVVSFMPRPLYPQGKSPPSPYPLDRRLGGPQNQSGCFRVEKNLFPLLGIEPWPPSPWPVAILPELYRLLLSIYKYMLKAQSNNKLYLWQFKWLHVSVSISHYHHTLPMERIKKKYYTFLSSVAYGLR